MKERLKTKLKLLKNYSKYIGVCKIGKENSKKL